MLIHFAMQKFVYLTVGFEKPTPEIMQAWGKWFESIKENIVEHIGLKNGKEISKTGNKDLPMDLNAVTGVMIVNAESHEHAMKMAATNPFITSIRVYELMSH